MSNKKDRHKKEAGATRRRLDRLHKNLPLHLSYEDLTIN